ncbi:hypothetical protein GPB2148_1271 [marine gamma proteobacterium HTCC2148]|nr:hypothetical protein GPB2148_1271 [marine gamma proteobacterium HTCC2148]
MEISRDLYYSSLLFHHTRRLWRWLARIESGIFREDIDKQSITAPIYIAGIARSGSTILLEMLNQHPHLACHRYSDFPNFYTPYWNNWLHQRTLNTGGTPKERSHSDRILITRDSPEAIEEAIWMEFFPHCHSLETTQVLGAEGINKDFESFYREHIAKLLLVRNRKRYLTKGNYNLTRLGYIHKLFPDARFLMPVRHPVNHIASMMKQDRLFCEGLKNNPRSQAYLGWAGHFEFGPDKRFINLGNRKLTEDILERWAAGDMVEGWALHWKSLYEFALNQQKTDTNLSAATLLVRYEDLCNNSEATIEKILQHCLLPKELFEETAVKYSNSLTLPDYYQPSFSKNELGIIQDICGETAAHIGYGCF